MNPAANPFLLPGLGQAGDAASNPLLASLEMMRDAWQRMAGLGGADGGLLGAQPLSVDEMDRRIAELRAVENWLRLNLSMLTSSIQGLEVQRATLNTLKAFATNPASVASGLGVFGASPRSPAPEPRRETSAPRDTAPPPRQAQDEAPADEENDASALAAAGAAQAAAAAQGWWDMLQQQFNSLAAATAASLQVPPAEASGTDAKAPARRGASKTAGAGTSRPAASKSARKTSTSTRAAASPRKRTRP